MAEVRLINNLKGILYYLDTPLLDFEVKDRTLIKAVDLSGGKLYPMELAVWGISYGNLNAFFEICWNPTLDAPLLYKLIRLKLMREMIKEGAYN